MSERKKLRKKAVKALSSYYDINYVKCLLKLLYSKKVIKKLKKDYKKLTIEQYKNVTKSYTINGVLYCNNKVASFRRFAESCIYDPLLFEMIVKNLSHQTLIFKKIKFIIDSYLNETYTSYAINEKEVPIVYIFLEISPIKAFLRFR